MSDKSLGPTVSDGVAEPSSDPKTGQDLADIGPTGASNEMNNQKPVMDINQESKESQVQQSKDTQMQQLKENLAQQQQQQQDDEEDQEEEDMDFEKPIEISSLTGDMVMGTRKIISILLQSYVSLFVIFIGILSLYWATFYRRETRFVNMKVLVINEDNSFGDGQQLGLIGDTFIDMVTNNPVISKLAGWDIVSLQLFQQTAQANNRSIVDEIQEQVHSQKYWAGVQIKPNSTQLIYNMLSTANSSIAESGALYQLINIYYQSASYFPAVSQYLIKNLYFTEQSWINDYVTPNVYNVLTSSLNSTQKSTLFSSPQVSSCLSTLPIFNFRDLRPTGEAITLGPTELGLLYAQMFSFHQFNFSLEIFRLLRTNIKYKSYVFYRILASQINCLVLALAYCLITLAFQISVTTTFGHSGFLVYWMVMYLYMAACAGINEIVVGLILAYEKIYLIPPWMIFNLLINMSPTFSAFALSPGFFRYGYAMPMYCAHQILKVIFFDTWKGELGQNFGVLVAWLIVTNVILMFNLNWSSRRSKRKARRELLKKERAFIKGKREKLFHQNFRCNESKK